MMKGLILAAVILAVNIQAARAIDYFQYPEYLIQRYNTKCGPKAGDKIIFRGRLKIDKYVYTKTVIDTGTDYHLTFYSVYGAVMAEVNHSEAVELKLSDGETVILQCTVGEWKRDNPNLKNSAKLHLTGCTLPRIEKDKWIEQRAQCRN